ncbi:UDP-N-acetylglucosamine 2-epimerase (non-hydrolyzing) [Marinilabiliaceae bacterium JC017]|nr:UDP-N-acetylglucosamine 2-epimerase (non-hydrolyzing) [Marinilabiliaceae bacterium JC017]
MVKIILVAGARPNFIKIAPLYQVLHQVPTVEVLLCHTGQHYDSNMSQVYFEELGIPEPDYNLGVNGGTHGWQTGQIMMRFDEVMEKEQPQCVIVVGDVNSTLACGLVAVKRGVKLVHVEAGLRSFDRSMPEEINRIVTDSIADLLFVSEKSGLKHLHDEGIPSEKVHFVGNVMIDSLVWNKARIHGQTILDDLSVKKENYAVVTLHRPSNVDDPVRFRELVNWLCDISKKVKIVWPVHPRTQKRMVADDFFQSLPENIIVTDPLGYLSFQKLISTARIVITDSGGVQEETTYLGIPCITLRRNTERPITIECGTNYLVGDDLTQATKLVDVFLNGKEKSSIIPDLWDGTTAERIVSILLERL